MLSDYFIPKAKVNSLAMGFWVASFTTYVCVHALAFVAVQCVCVCMYVCMCGNTFGACCFWFCCNVGAFDFVNTQSLFVVGWVELPNTSLKISKIMQDFEFLITKKS